MQDFAQIEWPAGIRGRVGSILDHQEPLPDGADLKNAKSLRRQREFNAGRNIARDLLGDGDVVGINPQTGAPVWPLGVVGSISHSRELVAVALAPSSAIAGIGIDIEAHGRFRNG
ncbi:hypothetical protein [Asticcacaulis sp. W401b]|uniref:hypothetical protein n=1 Tax=Asticcacaulis sp. W401b TaxID=3388666 RepID=UPI0039709601